MKKNIILVWLVLTFAHTSKAGYFFSTFTEKAEQCLISKNYSVDVLKKYKSENLEPHSDSKCVDDGDVINGTDCTLFIKSNDGNLYKVKATFRIGTWAYFINTCNFNVTSVKLENDDETDP